MWVALFIYVITLVSPFIESMYSITKIPNTYFEVKVKDKKAIYKQVSTMPGDWIPLDKISKRLRGAIVSSEDGKFFTHPGYDIEELQDAINDGVVKKKKKVSQIYLTKTKRMKIHYKVLVLRFSNSKNRTSLESISLLIQS